MPFEIKKPSTITAHTSSQEVNKQADKAPMKELWPIYKAADAKCMEVLNHFNTENLKKLLQASSLSGYEKDDLVKEEYKNSLDTQSFINIISQLKIESDQDVLKIIQILENSKVLRAVIFSIDGEKELFAETKLPTSKASNSLIRVTGEHLTKLLATKARENLKKIFIRKEWADLFFKEAKKTVNNLMNFIQIEEMMKRLNSMQILFFLLTRQNIVKNRLSEKMPEKSKSLMEFLVISRQESLEKFFQFMSIIVDKIDSKGCREKVNIFPIIGDLCAIQEIENSDVLENLVKKLANTDSEKQQIRTILIKARIFFKEAFFKNFEDEKFFELAFKNNFVLNGLVANSAENLISLLKLAKGSEAISLRREGITNCIKEWNGKELVKVFSFLGGTHSHYFDVYWAWLKKTYPHLQEKAITAINELIDRFEKNKASEQDIKLFFKLVKSQKFLGNVDLTINQIKNLLKGMAAVEQLGERILPEDYQAIAKYYGQIIASLQSNKESSTELTELINAFAGINETQKDKFVDFILAAQQFSLMITQSKEKAKDFTESAKKIFLQVKEELDKKVINLSCDRGRWQIENAKDKKVDQKVDQQIEELLSQSLTRKNSEEGLRKICSLWVSYCLAVDEKDKDEVLKKLREIAQNKDDSWIELERKIQLVLNFIKEEKQAVIDRFRNCFNTVIDVLREKNLSGKLVIVSGTFQDIHNTTLSSIRSYLKELLNFDEVIRGQLLHLFFKFFAVEYKLVAPNDREALCEKLLSGFKVEQKANKIKAVDKFLGSQKDNLLFVRSPYIFAAAYRQDLIELILGNNYEFDELFKKRGLENYITAESCRILKVRLETANFQQVLNVLKGCQSKREMNSLGAIAAKRMMVLLGYNDWLSLDSHLVNFNMLVDEWLSFPLELKNELIEDLRDMFCSYTADDQLKILLSSENFGKDLIGLLTQAPQGNRVRENLVKKNAGIVEFIKKAFVNSNEENKPIVIGLIGMICDTESTFVEQFSLFLNIDAQEYAAKNSELFYNLLDLYGRQIKVQNQYIDKIEALITDLRKNEFEKAANFINEMTRPERRATEGRTTYVRAQPLFQTILLILKIIVLTKNTNPDLKKLSEINVVTWRAGIDQKINNSSVPHEIIQKKIDAIQQEVEKNNYKNSEELLLELQEKDLEKEKNENDLKSELNQLRCMLVSKMLQENGVVDDKVQIGLIGECEGKLNEWREGREANAKYLRRSIARGYFILLFLSNCPSWIFNRNIKNFCWALFTISSESVGFDFLNKYLSHKTEDHENQIFDLIIKLLAAVEGKRSGEEEGAYQKRNAETEKKKIELLKKNSEYFLNFFANKLANSSINCWLLLAKYLNKTFVSKQEKSKLQGLGNLLKSKLNLEILLTLFNEARAQDEQEGLANLLLCCENKSDNENGWKKFGLLLADFFKDDSVTQDLVKNADLFISRMLEKQNILRVFVKQVSLAVLKKIATFSIENDKSALFLAIFSDYGRDVFIERFKDEFKLKTTKQSKEAFCTENIRILLSFFENNYSNAKAYFSGDSYEVVRNIIDFTEKVNSSASSSAYSLTSSTNSFQYTQNRIS